MFDIQIQHRLRYDMENLINTHLNLKQVLIEFTKPNLSLKLFFYRDASKEEKENQQDKKPSTPNTPNLDDLKSQLPFSSLFQQPSPGGQIRPPPQLPPHTSVAGHMPPTSPAIFHPSGFAAAAAAAAAGIDSPLQRMASITNSLISQPLPAPGFGQRPLKAILPPITQHQVKNTILNISFFFENKILYV